MKITTLTMTGLIMAMLLVSAPAQAYIDPGTGSFMIQGLIAGVIGAGVAIKLFWHKIKAALTGKSAADPDDD